MRQDSSSAGAARVMRHACLQRFTSFIVPRSAGRHRENTTQKVGTAEPAESLHDFDHRFKLEELRSEILRATVLAAIAGIGSFAVLLHVYVMRVTDDALPAGSSVATFVLAVAIALLLFELGARQVLRRRLERSEPIPRGLRFVNVAGEISVVTITLVYVGHATGNLAQALALPIYAAYFLFIILSTLRLDGGVSLFTGLTAAVQYAAVGYIAYETAPASSAELAFTGSAFYTQKAAALVAGGLLAGFVARQIKEGARRTLRTIEERDRVLMAFGQHTSPAVVDAILQDENAGIVQRRTVTVLFMDIRKFSSFSEHHEPEEVVSYLNTLFEPLIDIVHRHGGSIHQLLGDGFMAVLGAPIDHARDSERAVEAAYAMIRHMRRDVAAGLLPPTHIGIGIHAGEAVVGMVGSSIHKEYKVTGDVVNLAARIEQLNKRFNSQLLVSEAVWNGVMRAGYPAIDLGDIDVAGYERPIRVYKLA